jgi:hypothetical protein
LLRSCLIVFNLWAPITWRFKVGFSVILRVFVPGANCRGKSCMKQAMQLKYRAVKRRRLKNLHFFFYSLTIFETHCKVIGKKSSSNNRSSSLVEICSKATTSRAQWQCLKEQRHVLFQLLFFSLAYYNVEKVWKKKIRFFQLWLNLETLLIFPKTLNLLL